MMKTSAKTSFFTHPQAIVEPGSTIGAGSRIWAFAHVLPQAVIGRDCNICDHVFVENDVVVGDRVTVKCGVQLWDGVTLEDDVFVGPNATFTNDPFPRSGQHLGKYPRTVVCAKASIGANATILPGIKIGSQAMVGAGAVVTRDVPPHAIVTGNPARIIGYSTGETLQAGTPGRTSEKVGTSRVPGVKLYDHPLIVDMRGSLSAAEAGKQLPFVPHRYFMVSDVPSSEVRGEHAHKKCHQYLTCVHGKLSVVVDDGTHRDEFLLDRPNLSLYIPPMIWATQYKYSANAVLMVLASDPYDSADYIRDYDEYLRVTRKHGGE